MRPPARLIPLALLLACAPGPGEEEALLASQAQALVGVPVDGYPNYQERLMLVALNRARAQPNDVALGTAGACPSQGFTPAPVSPPLLLHHDGTRAARFHCQHLLTVPGKLSHNSFCTLRSDVGTSGCDGDPACACAGALDADTGSAGYCDQSGAGTRFSTRCGHFGFSSNGEVAAAGYGDGWSAVGGWIKECKPPESPTEGHRLITLDVGGTEDINKTHDVIGLGYAGGSGACWSRFYVGDLGRHNVTRPVLASGVHRPETRASSGTFDFYVNYYDVQGAPTSVDVVVDGVCSTMARELGTDTTATYKATATVGAGCHQYWFLVRDGAGNRQVWPESGAWGVGSCTDYVASALPAACEGCPAGQTRPCGTGACAGTQTCTGGAWSACDGAPPTSEACNGLDDDCNGSVPADESDGDGDGVRSCEGDCNDANASIHPGAAEQCNGLDDDCDGNVPAGEADADGDGVRSCEGDCDDGNASIHPGAAEQCNGLDDDCDGSVPAGEADGDGDGVRICAGDCDDGNASIHPGAIEQCNGLDDDCDGSVPADEADADGDGVRVCEGDCDDGDASIHPGAPEQCNGLDDDCDGTTDPGCACEDGAARPCGTETGECTLGAQTCTGGAWGTCVGATGPAPGELCNGLDDDCDGSVPASEADMDGDGVRVCEGDCDDGEGSVHPGAPETCNGVDDDCDGTTDPGCACEEGASRPCGSDRGACSAGTQACTGGTWDTCAGATGPAAEVCNGLDDDCDGETDELDCGSDGGTGSDAGAAGDGGLRETLVSGGCGCASAAGSPWAALPLLALALLRRRRPF